MKNLVKFIDKNALFNNTAEIKKYCFPNLLCAVIKSNAYGHGFHKTINSIDGVVDYYAVANIKEALIVRKFTDKPILVIGALDCSRIYIAILNNIHLTAASKNDLIKIAKNARKMNKKCNVHLKVDTGMHRLGFQYYCDFCDAIMFIKENPSIVLKGVYTHFGSQSKKRFNNQFKKFSNFCRNLPANVLKHYANSATSFISTHKNSFMSRIGISLYGYGKYPNITPALSLYARIISTNFVKKGDFIGYGDKHKAKKDMRVAILGVGYADGLMRCYHKKGYVLINNKKAKIVADICMNMTIVDITKIPNVKIGEFAIIIGKSKSHQITAETIAKKCKTISYEVLTNFQNAPCTKKKPVE